METDHADSPAGNGKRAAMNGFAAVGLAALVIGGIFLIIYVAKFIPETLSRLSSAVYLSPEATQNPTGSPATSTQPTASNNEPTASAPTQATTTKPATSAPAPTGGPSYSYPTYTYPTGPRLYGLPDLSPEVLAVGRLTSSSANSFVADSSISENDRPAVRFRVHNFGTNVVSFWQVEIVYPSDSGDDTYLITSRDVLYPGGYKDFTFGFDNPDTGNNREFAITTDPNGYVAEGNERNNRDTADIDIGGSSNSSSDISCDLWLSDNSIDDGDSTTLHWDTDGDVRDASINHGIGNVDENGGSKRVSPSTDTTYRMTITDRHGDDETCSVTLRVN